MDALSLAGGLILGGIMLLKAQSIDIDDDSSSDYESEKLAHIMSDIWHDDSPVPANPYAQQQADLDILWGAGLILLTGGKGSGKSTASDAIIRRRIFEGHYLKIFNHQADFGQYQGIKLHQTDQQELECADIVYGVDSSKARRFESIAEGIEHLLEFSDQRLQVRQSKPESEWDFMEAPITIVVEEMSEWAENIPQELCQKFWQCLNSEFRRANIYAVIVAHDTTSALLGGQKGYSKLIKTAGTVQLELQNKPDNSAVGGFSPTGKGILSVSGQNPRLIKTGLLRDLIPKGKEFDYRDILNQLASTTPNRTLSPVAAEGSNEVAPKPARSTAESASQESGSDHYATASSLPKYALDALKRSILERRSKGESYTKIVREIWGVTGGSEFEKYISLIKDLEAKQQEFE